MLGQDGIGNRTARADGNLAVGSYVLNIPIAPDGAAAPLSIGRHVVMDRFTFVGPLRAHPHVGKFFRIIVCLTSWTIFFATVSGEAGLT